jgi:hypothetical protein
MNRPRANSLTTLISEKFRGVWVLLSETTNFLSRTHLLPQYESQFRQWRAILQSSHNNNELALGVKRELIELRRNLRFQGYDLSLGSQILTFDGFRNDACLREGFRRIVLFIGDEGVYWLVGEDNHVTLSNFLEERMNQLDVRQIRERHYLWYQRRKNELVFSGSDTEMKEDFERLKRIGEANPMLFLSSLKSLR